MRCLHCAALAAVAVLGFASTASAADMPTKAPIVNAPVAVPYNWTGFYVGVNGGYGSGNNCWTDVGPGASPRGQPVPADEGCHTVSGWLAGGQIGYNFQSNAWVFGAEFSGDWTNLEGGNFATLDKLGYDQTKLRNLFSLTGRVGMTWQAFLLYAKGGGAFTHEYAAIPVGSPSGPLRSSGSDDRYGWTVGVGAEYEIMPNVSAALEYDYYDFGRRNVTLYHTDGSLDVIESISQYVNAVTLRLNYRFGGH